MMKQLVVTVLLLAGCGDTMTVEADAQPDPRFACSGHPTPTTAPDPVTLRGTTIDIVGLAPLANATVAAFGRGRATPDVMTVSDANGAYQLAVPTGGAPVDGYLRASTTGYLDSYFYASAPTSADAAAQTIAMITRDALLFTASRAGVTQASTSGTMLVRVADCEGVPLAGAVLTVTPSATLRYGVGGMPDQNATMTDAGGLVFVYNVSPGDVELGGTVEGVSLRANRVGAIAGAATLAGIRP